MVFDWNSLLEFSVLTVSVQRHSNTCVLKVSWAPPSTADPCITYVAGGEVYDSKNTGPMVLEPRLVCVSPP